jgi:hypothetical protein
MSLTLIQAIRSLKRRPGGSRDLKNGRIFSDISIVGTESIFVKPSGGGSIIAVAGRISVRSQERIEGLTFKRWHAWGVFVGHDLPLDGRHDKREPDIPGVVWRKGADIDLESLT